MLDSKGQHERPNNVMIKPTTINRAKKSDKSRNVAMTMMITQVKSEWLGSTYLDRQFCMSHSKNQKKHEFLPC